MQTAPFTATPIEPLTGTYIGVPANGNSPFGSGSVVSVQVMQGAPTLVQQGGMSRYQIPLTATLTVTNSVCPFAGSTAAYPGPSLLSGDRFDLNLIADFPYGALSGTLSDPSADTFFGDLTTLAIVNGCPGVAFYNFTRK